MKRDAAIQRFQFTFEAVWKAAQRYLRDVEGLEAGGPKSTVRESLRSGVLSETDAEHLLLLADDRNLAVNTYNEDLARSLAGRLHGHAALLRRWVDSMDPSGRS